MARSPGWSPPIKRIIATALVLALLLLLVQIRALLVPFLISAILAYILLPVVEFLENKAKMRRGFATALVFLVLALILAAIPVTTIPQLVDQVNAFVANLPGYLDSLGGVINKQYEIGPFSIALDRLPVDDGFQYVRDNLVTMVQTVGRQSLLIFGNIASATVTTITWLLLIMILSFYILKDSAHLKSSLVDLAPATYRGDLERLVDETRFIWNAFLRGQMALALTIGLITLVVALIIGLPNALLLALLAGLLEFVPNIGPFIAAVPAVLLALFRSDASWLGQLTGPLVFALIVAGIYIVIQQLENIVLVPRIIGKSLNLRPIFVFAGILVGASLAGILGILLAAPMLATSRLLFMYVYRKLLDQPPFGDLAETADDEDDIGKEIEENHERSARP